MEQNLPIYSLVLFLFLNIYQVSTVHEKKKKGEKERKEKDICFLS